MPDRLLSIFLVGLVALINATEPAACQSAEKNPLELEVKIPLGHVSGRIDHMAVDVKRQRLFVAELGNDTVSVVDLAKRSVGRRITGLKEPQGVGYDPLTDTLFVANARDGAVHLYVGGDYKPAGQIDLGSDADNIRVDVASKRVVLGYGNGALAFIDPATHSKIGDAALRAHPESFQIDQDAGRILVNVPDAHSVAVIDEASAKQVATWPMDKSGNFAMAMDHALGRVLLAFRSPPELDVYTIADGKRVAAVETCGDIDDLFVDQKRNRVYVSCGAGFVDVLESNGARYRRKIRIPTAPGARTSFFSPELDRLLVATRSTAAEPAAIWIFRPLP
jgi:YVTN family beta-propeller protein